MILTGAVGVPSAGATSPAAGEFVPITPLRLLDTRDGAPLGAGEARPLVVTGRGSVPAAGQVRAVALTVTATRPTVGGFVSVYPWGAAGPGASNLNFVPTQTVANSVVVGVGDGGQVALYNGAGNTDLVVDIVGWFSATPVTGGGRFLPVIPQRLADTRPDRPIFGGEALILALANDPPYDEVTSVALNVTATQPQGHGYFLVTPWDVPLPGASTLNFVPGETVASATFTALGPQRRIGVYNGSPQPVHQVVDLNGVFVHPEKVNSGGTFTPVTPFRLLDTRTGGGPLGALETRTVQVRGVGSIPVDAGAVVANVTVVDPTAPTYVSLWQTGQAQPGVSNVNADPGETVPNLVNVALGDGKVQLFNAQGSANVIIDVVGWYSTIS